LWELWLLSLVLALVIDLPRLVVRYMPRRRAFKVSKPEITSQDKGMGVGALSAYKATSAPLPWCCHWIPFI
jgi:hypothetical protein